MFLSLGVVVLVVFEVLDFGDAVVTVGAVGSGAFVVAVVVDSFIVFRS